MIKRIWKKIEGINGVILILYSIFIFSSYAFTSKYAKGKISYFPRSVIWIVVLSILLCPLLIKWLSKKSIIVKPSEAPSLSDRKHLLLFFLISLGVLLFHYITYYPGSFTTDFFNQYDQALHNTYNDWHPAVHTLIAIKLPLMLTGGWIGSIVLFQIILFSVAIAYAVYTVLVHTDRYIAYFVLGFILLNPETGNIATYVLKDLYFSMGTLVLIAFSLHIYYSKGDWIKKPTHMIAFILILSLTTMIRHNAVLFTVPLLFALLFFISKKRGLVLLISCIIIVFIIKVPLYSLIGVQQADERKTEMLGLPMTIIGAAVTDTPEELDDEILDFAYSVAPREVWEENYIIGNYNTVKFDERTDNSVIESYGTQRVISMMMRCFKESPTTSIYSLICLTDPLYTVSDDTFYHIYPGIVKNTYGIEQKGIRSFQTNNKIYTTVFMNCLPHLFLYVGAMHLLLITSILSKCKLKKLRDWKKIFLILPVFIYNFGTMFLLTGASDSSRFFYYTFLLTPLYIILLFGKKRDETEYRSKDTGTDIASI